MQSFAFLLVVFGVAVATVESAWSCNRDEAIAAFEKKTAGNHFLINENPYKNQTDESMKKLMAYLKDDTTVCAIKYSSDVKKDLYFMKTFDSESEALKANHIITHQGKLKSTLFNQGGHCKNISSIFSGIFSVFQGFSLSKLKRIFQS